MTEKMKTFPLQIPNWINGQEQQASSGEWFEKLSPHNGVALGSVARSRAADVNSAVEAAKRAQIAWADTPAVQR